jgi:glutamate-ammonia-ligase adenylyltransferase
MQGEFLETLAGLSRFLYEEVRRHPEWLECVEPLGRRLSRREFESRLQENPACSLAELRRRELVRIALRDGLGYASLQEVTEELSLVADAIIARALKLAGAPPRLAVIALGKLGGLELNYSSDIDLMFVQEEGDPKAANRVVDLLSEYTNYGPAYRVDLRLRPEGRSGSLSLSLEAAQRYYATRARKWELQMLIKARTAAGDDALGSAFLDAVEPLVYSTDIDVSAIEAMSYARERWNQALARKHLPIRGVNVKLAPGGIRDIEFLVQCLQRLHGARDPQVRHAGTLLALERLRNSDLLSQSEYVLLTEAYTYLRQVEHRLQLAEDRQVHTLLDRPENRETLAQVRLHLGNVRGVYRRIIHAQRPLPAPPKALAPQQPPQAAPHQQHSFELTPYLNDLLAHHPEYAADIQREIDFPARRWAFEGLTAPLQDIDGLRAFFRRELFRIQVASLRTTPSIFQTLDATSALAEFVIARAYRIAREQCLDWEPAQDMSVIALGRLGMREFDLGSDADLVFVLPDSQAAQIQSWTRVAERLISILAAYTGEAPALNIDTRLRPYGREGPLVQTESQYFSYLARDAEAWEGLAFMKARGVAGNVHRATRFLINLQQVDWQRYGQSGRSRDDLRQMRMKLQREAGALAPLKAGQGAYYDADFILMYLRLKDAGLFFKSLNTPERIRILEKTGHLDRNAAELLLAGTTFFRALDHAIRVVTGRREGKLPSGPLERKLVVDLLARWTGGDASDLSLEEQSGLVRASMRRLFDAVFSG